MSAIDAASVAYTTPTSFEPSATAVSTAVTLAHSLTSFDITSSKIPILVKISLEYEPTGTSSPARAIFLAEVILSKPVTLVSTPLPLINTTLFSSKGTTEPSSIYPPSLSSFICFSAAEKNISQDAPSVI